MPLNAEPVGAAEFAAWMTPFEPFAKGRRVAVAVSGGAHSMALAVLLSQWGRPEALIVDHGLRSEAADEARLATEQLARFGVPSRVLALRLQRGPALAERARTARYDALAEACRDAGLTDLTVGHHAQDQAETFLLREAKGSGPAGLAGMAAVVHYNQVRVLRPMLAAAPDRLRATLRQAGILWSEDPTNHDPATPRAVFRDRLRGQDGLRPLRHSASAAGVRRHGTELAVLEELGSKAAFYPEGFAHVTSDTLRQDALSSLVWMISGRAHPPSPASVARLAPGLQSSTLHGVIVAPAGRLGAGWLVAREAGGPAVPARDRALWDGRFRLRGDPPPGTVIRALGHVPSVRRRSDLPWRVLRSLPALYRNDALVAAPHLGYPDAAACRRLCFTFEPGRPAGPAPFVRG